MGRGTGPSGVGPAEGSHHGFEQFHEGVVEGGIRAGRDHGAEGEGQVPVGVTVRDRDEVLDTAVGDVDALVRVSGYVSLRAQSRDAVEIPRLVLGPEGSGEGGEGEKGRQVPYRSWPTAVGRPDGALGYARLAEHRPEAAGFSRSVPFACFGVSAEVFRDSAPFAPVCHGNDLLADVEPDRSTESISCAGSGRWIERTVALALVESCCGYVQVRKE